MSRHPETVARLEIIRRVFAERDARRLHTTPALVDPAAGTDGTVGNRAPHFASQRDAALALKHRLDRDRVQHPPKDTTPEAA